MSFFKSLPLWQSPYFFLWKWEVIMAIISIAIFSAGLHLLPQVLLGKKPSDLDVAVMVALIVPFVALIVAALATSFEKSGSLVAASVPLLASLAPLAPLVASLEPSLTVLAKALAVAFVAALMGAFVATLVANYADRNGLKKRKVYASLVVEFLVIIGGYYAAYQIII